MDYWIFDGNCDVLAHVLTRSFLLLSIFCFTLTLTSSVCGATFFLLCRVTVIHPSSSGLPASSFARWVSYKAKIYYTGLYHPPLLGLPCFTLANIYLSQSPVLFTNNNLTSESPTCTHPDPNFMYPPTFPTKVHYGPK